MTRFVVTFLFAFIGVPAGFAQEKPITFALIGDVPYSEHAVAVDFPNMIAEINQANVAFTVHDGDIKSGSTPCTNSILDAMFASFQQFESPLIYLFGDNEWTDCEKHQTNGLSPDQWLQVLRDRFCKGDQSLGKRTLKLTRQSEKPDFSIFRENVRWAMGGVLFVGLNVPGNANNFGQEEFAERNKANIAWIKEGFALAKSSGSRAIMIMQQANPHYDLPATNALRRGFNEMLKVLEKETLAFPKPVVLVHGDSHYFRIDKPMLSPVSHRRVENFTRVETFGNPDVHWIEVTIDPADPAVFVFRPKIIRKNLIDHSKPAAL